MAKRFKLKFNIPSFQMCRSKDPSSFPGNPVPAIYRLSPVNHNARHTRHPSIPSPSPSKITSIAQGCKMCHDKQSLKKLKSIRGRKSTSSVPSRRSDFRIDNIEEEESETLISCMTSFSDEFCLGEEKELSTGSSSQRRKMSSVKKVRSVRFQSSEKRRGAEVKKTTVTRKSVEGKVRESFAVVKKSKDPYEDFKKSMMEMITEMEMSEAEDLEQLLQCFLALNSRSYHAVIVRAFMEIWQQMFVMKNLQTNVKTQEK